MNVFKQVRTFILADPLLAAQIGTRLYPIKLPQAPTYPAVTMQRISDTRFPPLKGRASLARVRYQFDVWTKEGVGSAYEVSQTIGTLLLNRLEGRNIDVLDDDASPAVYRKMWFEFDNARDLFEPDVSGGFYRYSADYFIMHQTGHGGT